MKYRSTKKWDDPSGSRALLYFAQVMEEMLFDFSLDTYKPSVMHSGLLVAEALQTIDEVNAGNIKEPNIGHVLSELSQSLERDQISTSLIKLPLTSVLAILKNPKSGKSELRSILEILNVQISKNKYRVETERLLAAAIKSKSTTTELRRLSRSYATCMIACGFSQKHLLEATKNFFYHGPNRIGGNNAIDEFILIFPKKPQEYSILFKVDALLKNSEKALTSLGLKFSSNLPSDFYSPNHVGFTKLGETELYGFIETITAYDWGDARSKAERIIRLSSTLLNLFHHKKHLTWSTDCLAVVKETREHKIISRAINPMQRCADLVEGAASQRLQSFASTFSLEQNSFMKFIRSAQLHGLALASQNEENQILNLWIALESLVPSESKSDNSSNIEHVVHSITPFLNESYIQNLLNNLTKDLIRWDRKSLHSIVREIPGRRFMDKLARIFSLSDFEIQREALKASCDRAPLLRDRLDFFSSILASPREVIKAIDAHQQRLEWQIRRIYRARNIIVHSGRIPSYTHPLIEHAHNYLDTILDRLVELASAPKKVHSVAQGFKYTEIRYQSFRERLNKPDLKFSKENIEPLLFDF
jgi:hypothetical protein